MLIRYNYFLLQQEEDAVLWQKEHHQQFVSVAQH